MVSSLVKWVRLSQKFSVTRFHLVSSMALPLNSSSKVCVQSPSTGGLVPSQSGVVGSGRSSLIDSMVRAVSASGLAETVTETPWLLSN